MEKDDIELNFWILVLLMIVFNALAGIRFRELGTQLDEITAILETLQNLTPLP